MAVANDRGYAMIRTNEDGTSTVLICSSIEHGKPVGIYAKYVMAPSVHIDPGVRLVRTAHSRYTRDVVEVTHRAGQVRIRPRVHSLRA
jgi:hypothetical protein